MRNRIFALTLLIAFAFTGFIVAGQNPAKPRPIYRLMIYMDTGGSMREGEEVMKLAGMELPSWLNMLIKGNSEYRPLPDKFILNVDAYCIKNGNQIITEQRYTHNNSPNYDPLMNFGRVSFFADDESRNELLFKRQINPQSPACRDTVFVVLSNSVYEPIPGAVLTAAFKQANSVFIFVKLPRDGAYKSKQALQKVVNDRLTKAFGAIRDSIPGLKRKIELNILPLPSRTLKDGRRRLEFTAIFANGLLRKTGPIRYKVTSVTGAKLTAIGPALNGGELLRELKGGETARLNVPINFAQVTGPDVKLNLLFTANVGGGEVNFKRQIHLKDVIPVAAKTISVDSYICKWGKKKLYKLESLPPGTGKKSFTLNNVFSVRKVSGKGAVRLKIVGAVPENIFDSIVIDNSKQSAIDYDSDASASLRIKLAKLPVNQDCLIQLSAKAVNGAQLQLDETIYEIKLVGLLPQKIRFLSKSTAINYVDQPPSLPINMLDVKYPVKLLVLYTAGGRKVSGVVAVNPGEKRPVLPWTPNAMTPLPDKITIAAPNDDCMLVPYRGTEPAGTVELQLKDVRKAPPKADFISSVNSGRAPLTVSFINRSQNADSYHWDFGNGETSKAMTPPPVVYRTPAKMPYTVTLTAISGTRKSVKRTTVTVNALPPPIAAFSFIQPSGKAPLYVKFTNKSKHFDSCRWDFGKGASPDKSTSISPPKIKFAEPGEYSIKLTVFGEDGASETTTKTIKVKGQSAIPMVILSVILAIIVAIVLWIFLHPRAKLEVCFYRAGRETGVKPLKGTMSLSKAFGCNINLRIYALFDKELDDWQFEMTCLGDDAQVEFVRDGSRIKVTENTKTASLRLGRYSVIGTDDEFEIREPED
jgi:PKD repeat protein